MNPRKLSPKVSSLVDYSLARQTRIHPLPSSPSNRVWIKREDELSSGISGSKMRKYASLVPSLKSRSIEHVAMIGGSNSNNLVGLAQLLRENKISHTAFIREAADSAKRGNALFLDMLLVKEEKVFVPRSTWDSVEELAKTYLESKRIPAGRFQILKEGCFHFDALLGTLTLAEDILRNEFEHSLFFDRIYIDSGTGLSAIGLILGLSILEENLPADREIVVTLIAGDQPHFKQGLTQMQELLSRSLDCSMPALPRIRYRTPTLSPKFGSVNSSLFRSARAISKQEGIIMDPTYSVKHYESMKHDLQNAPEIKTALFVFNGSALGTCGFQDFLAGD